MIISKRDNTFILNLIGIVTSNEPHKVNLSWHGCAESNIMPLKYHCITKCFVDKSEWDLRGRWALPASDPIYSGRMEEEKKDKRIR